MSGSAPRPAVIVTIDQVLIEGRSGQRRAARLASGAYLEEICHIRDGARLVRQQHVTALGDACNPGHPAGIASAVVMTFLASLSPSLRPPPHRAHRTSQVEGAFRGLGLRYGELTGVSERRIEPLVEAIAARGGGLDGLRAALGHDTIFGYVLFGGGIGVGERLAALGPEAEADQRKRLAAVPDDAIGRLFQEFYLGDAQFEAIYGLQPSRSRGPGEINHEIALVAREALERLVAVADLHVATLRSREEASLALERAGVTDLVSSVTSLGAAAERDLAVGVSWPVAECIRRADLDPQHTLALVGSTRCVSDALASGARAIGFAWCRDVRRPLKQAGAEAVISKLDTLTRVVGRMIE